MLKFGKSSRKADRDLSRGVPLLQPRLPFRPFAGAARHGYGSIELQLGVTQTVMHAAVPARTKH
jgi:hypothetical protein